MINPMREDWEIEAFNERYEAFAKICGRALFWTIVVLIIGGIVANMAMLTWMVKSWHDNVYRPGKAIAAQLEESYYGEN
jgi:hypothetical protein